MKILLIKPFWPYPYSKGEHTYNRIWPPLSLANCAAILEKQGHAVKILDAHALRIRPHKIREHLDGFDKIFITSSSLDKWQCPNIDIDTFLETVQAVKEVSDEVHILGYHGTKDPNYLLSKTGAKSIVRGEPEYIVADICNGGNLANIPGISFNNNSRIISNQDREDFNLTDLPLPAYHLLDTKKYSYEVLGNNFAMFETNRGCKYSCSFCNKIMYGKTLRTKSKNQIESEIEAAVQQHGVKTGYFIDLDFLTDKQIVNDVCDFLINKDFDFHWCCQTRPDALNPEILNKMKKAGCRLIHLGVETGLQKFLDLLNKNITLETIRRSVQMCTEAGIQTLAFFIFGFQGETAEDREKIFNFSIELNTDFISFHRAYPYEQNNIFLSDTESTKKIDNFIRRKFFEYYFRISYLKKMNLATLIRCTKLFLGRLVTL